MKLLRLYSLKRMLVIAALSYGLGICSCGMYDAIMNDRIEFVPIFFTLMASETILIWWTVMGLDKSK